MGTNFLHAHDRCFKPVRTYSAVHQRRYEEVQTQVPEVQLHEIVLANQG